MNGLTAAVVLISVLVGAGLMILARTLFPPDKNAPQVKVLGTYSPLLSAIKYRRFPDFKRLAQALSAAWPRAKAVAARFSQWPRFWRWVGFAIELSLVVVWAMWVGRRYLDFNPQSQPNGNDFTLNVQSYFALSSLKECGACVFWNGSYNGGLPTLAETLVPIAHPVTVAIMWLWGIMGGVKLIVVMALVLAGVAQWWLAKVLGLGRLARVWSAGLAVVGGHLAGRMEMGLVEVVFSAASCSLVIPAALDLALTGRRRSAVVFGLLLGLALLSGQGYMQLGLALGIFPAFLVLLVDERLRLRPVWKEFVVGGGIALLVAAILWVPALHFSSNFTKPSDPGNFDTAQSILYQPLNLVINDHNFYNTDVLKPLAWPHQYVNYVGWIPVLLALLAFRLVPRSARRLLVFLLAGIVLVYMTSSAVTLMAIVKVTPESLGEWARRFRFPSEISSLVVPLVLALSAWGLDFLMKMKWPHLTLDASSGTWLKISAAWLILPLPLLFAINSALEFGQGWLATGELPADYARIVPGLKPSAAEWVQPPGSDWGFALTALEHGFKLTGDYRPWVWRDRPLPPPSMQATRDDVDPNTPGFRTKIEYLNVIDYPDAHYASVVAGDQTVPCLATARGGDIDVDCLTEAPGQLVVYENNWSGWSVRRDGAPASLDQSQWLATSAPAGKHHYEFRYRPWDVAVGLALTIAGWLLALGLWWRAPAGEPSQPSLAAA